MHLFRGDLVARVFLEQDALAFHQLEQVVVRPQALLLMVVGFFPISVSLVIALESFVGEKERHSLEPLLSSPLTDAELYLGNPKNFGNQLKYADRRGSPLAIIQGGDERAAGVVQIKDLIEGKRLSGEIEDNAAWREARVAQVSVPTAELVEKVREMLAAQAEDRARG